MNQNDAQEFFSAMDLACGMLSKKHFDDSVLKGYFSLLAQYPIDDIKKSLNTLICSSDSQYGIRPDLIIKYMGIKEAKPETIEGILAKSKAKNSPLGIVASRHIKKWDHDNLSPFELRQKAAELIELLPNIETDIQQNGYDNHTLRLLVQYEIDPTGDFRDGIRGPESEDRTRDQYKALMIEDKKNEAAQEERRLKIELDNSLDEAYAEHAHREDRVARPGLWAEVDKLNADGKRGEAFRLLYPDLFSAKSASKKISENAEKHTAELAKVDELVRGE